MADMDTILASFVLGMDLMPPPKVSCPDDNGVVGYRYSHNGYWSLGYKKVSKDNRTLDCAERCTREPGCLRFNRLVAGRDAGACFLYFDKLGSMVKERVANEAYIKCQANGSKAELDDDDTKEFNYHRCPRGYKNILSVNSCSVAASALGLQDSTYSDQSHYQDSRPKGCFKWPNGMVYFNPTNGTPSRPAGIPVCEREQAIVEETPAKPPPTVCPDDNGITGYQYSHNGYWSLGYHKVSNEKNAHQCAEWCTRKSSCVRFSFLAAGRDAGACFIYFDKLGSMVKERVANEAYIKCQGNFTPRVR
jgi:hypothetical protein